MNIEPLSGLNIISFGDSRSAVKVIYGDPEEVKNQNGLDGTSSEIWIYSKYGLELYFDPDDNFRMWGMNVTSEEITLEGSCPVGLTEKDLHSKYSNLKLNMDDGKYKEFEYMGKEIEFWLKAGNVYLVRVWSKIGE